MALSMLSAMVGLLLGTLTGVSLAIVSTPAQASIATVSDSPLASLIGGGTSVEASTKPSSVASTNPITTQVSTKQAQPEVPVQKTDSATQALASASQPNSDGSKAETTSTASGELSAIPGVKLDHSPATQSAPGKIPVVDENESPIHPAAPAERHSTRPVAHPLTKPPRVVLASLSVDISAPSEDDPLNLEGDVKPPTFYSEGDLTIADYDAAKGTIQTIDGRTFVLGLTISTADATGWEDYRSSVHYRCSQEGSCTLTRSGVVAPNARLI